MALLDQLGTAVKRPSLPSSSGTALLNTLESFSDRLFMVLRNPRYALMTLPPTPWNGTYPSTAQDQSTIINLFGITQLGRDVIAEVRAAYDQDDLELAVPADEARERYFVRISSYGSRCEDIEADLLVLASDRGHRL